eukprot:TRINITY_DN2640_c0_g1_i2.p2 TRINITY_DN2640_c0_g1~~TRINITY_DN2640_c0_g1_i2.p2  ORF type:complete len:152 (+),score=35.32 TRINITY_DN2640_c0_g1_i2:257-712(+)
MVVTAACVVLAAVKWWLAGSSLIHFVGQAEPVCEHHPHGFLMALMRPSLVVALETVSGLLFALCAVNAAPVRIPALAPVYRWGLALPLVVSCVGMLALTFIFPTGVLGSAVWLFGVNVVICGIVWFVRTTVASSVQEISKLRQCIFKHHTV